MQAGQEHKQLERQLPSVQRIRSASPGDTDADRRIRSDVGRGAEDSGCWSSSTFPAIVDGLKTTVSAHVQQEDHGAVSRSRSRSCRRTTAASTGSTATKRAA